MVAGLSELFVYIFQVELFENGALILRAVLKVGWQTG